MRRAKSSISVAHLRSILEKRIEEEGEQKAKDERRQKTRRSMGRGFSPKTAKGQGSVRVWDPVSAPRPTPSRARAPPPPPARSTGRRQRPASFAFGAPAKSSSTGLATMASQSRPPRSPPRPTRAVPPPSSPVDPFGAVTVQVPSPPARRAFLATPPRRTHGGQGMKSPMATPPMPEYTPPPPPPPPSRQRRRPLSTVTPRSRPKRTPRLPCFDVVCVDRTGPPNARRIDKAIRVDVDQGTMHCYRNKVVDAIFSIRDIVRVECSVVDGEARVVLWGRGTQSDAREAAHKYMCELIFRTEGRLVEFSKLVLRCSPGIRICSGSDKRSTPIWIPDEQAPYCMLEQCHKAFSYTNRRHHCRKCGFVVCGSCSSHTAVLESGEGAAPVRVCDNCFRELVRRRISGLGTSSALSVRDGSAIYNQESSDRDRALRRKIHTHVLSPVAGGVSASNSVSRPLPPPARGPSRSAPTATAAEGAVKRDVYGFPLDQNNIHALPTWTKYLHAQRSRWTAYLSHHTAFDTGNEAVRALVRRGIPPELRGHLWPLLCGSQAHKQAAAEGYYSSLLARAEASPPDAAGQINKDLSRTFPEHVGYEAGDCQALLGRVLTAFAVHNPRVGYCQSMNFICALALLFTGEEDAFWLLTTIVEDICCVSPARSGSQAVLYHQPNLAGTLVDQGAFNELLKQSMPALVTHLDSVGFPLDCITTNWLMCLFVNTLPIEIALHVWDNLFLEGIAALFRAGLALLKLLEKKLLAASNFEGVLMTLRGVGQGDGLDVDRFMKTCFESPQWANDVTRDKIEKLRAHHLQEVLESLGSRPKFGAADKAVDDEKGVQVVMQVDKSEAVSVSNTSRHEPPPPPPRRPRPPMPTPERKRRVERLTSRDFFKIRADGMGDPDAISMHLDPQFGRRARALSWRFLSGGALLSRIGMTAETHQPKQQQNGTMPPPPPTPEPPRETPKRRLEAKIRAMDAAE